MIVYTTRRATKAAAIPLILLTALVAGSTSGFGAEPAAARQLSGLRQAPGIAVSPLPTVLPDHARGLGDQRRREPGNQGCNKTIDTGNTADSQIFANRVVAAQDNIICTNADIDVYTSGGSTFAVQGGATEAAWTHTDVSNPRQPVIVGQFEWTRSGGGGKTTTPDIKAFHQGANDYIALALERTAVRGFCGVVIVNVNQPGSPVIVSQFIGSGWCDTHNVFVENDVNGDGAYIYATADLTADLRVLAINDPALGATVANPIEVGMYQRTDRNPPNDADVFNDAYVHDVTVIEGIVYAAYWNKGVDILPASLIRQAGVTGLFADETSATNVRPPAFAPATPFLAHHAFPNADGSVVFIEDEITFDVDAGGNPVSGVEPVQAWTTGASAARVDGLLLDNAGGGDIPVNPAHNLEINFGLQPGRLYVGWYKMGLQAWDFDALGFTRLSATPTAGRTADAYHQAQVEAADEPYSGAWGVRLAEIVAVPAGGGAAVPSLFAFQSDRNFGLIVNCLGDGNGNLTNCPAGL